VHNFRANTVAKGCQEVKTRTLCDRERYRCKSIY